MARDAGSDHSLKHRSKAERRASAKPAAEALEKTYLRCRSDLEASRQEHHKLITILGCRGISSRLLAAAPDLFSKLFGAHVSPTDRLRRNVALHSVADDIDILTAPRMRFVGHRKAHVLTQQAGQEAWVHAVWSLDGALVRDKQCPRLCLACYAHQLSYV